MFLVNCTKNKGRCLQNTKSTIYNECTSTTLSYFNFFWALYCMHVHCIYCTCRWYMYLVSGRYCTCTRTSHVFTCCLSCPFCVTAFRNFYLYIHTCTRSNNFHRMTEWQWSSLLRLTCRLAGGLRNTGTFSSGGGGVGAGGTTSGRGAGDEEAEMSLPWYWVVWALRDATVL